MAISAVKTWVAGEVLTASDLNLEFANIYTGGDLSWPATSEKDLNGQEFWLDADKDSSFSTAVDDVLSLKLQGTALFKWDGNAATTPVDGFTFIAADTANPSAPSIAAVGASTNISIELTPKGSGIASVGGTRVLLLGAENSAQNILASQVFA